MFDVGDRVDRKDGKFNDGVVTSVISLDMVSVRWDTYNVPITENVTDLQISIAKALSVAPSSGSGGNITFNGSRVYGSFQDQFHDALNQAVKEIETGAQIRCECGSHAVGSKRHASWCQLNSIEG